MSLFSTNSRHCSSSPGRFCCIGPNLSREAHPLDRAVPARWRHRYHTTRTVTAKLAEALGQQIVIDNRPGSGGTIGLSIAAKLPPDGYHVSTGQLANMGIAPALYPKLPYDSTRDFAPISRVASAILVLVSHPSFPARTVKDLIAMARAKPGAITYGSPGNGTSGHLAVEMIRVARKLDMVHVPYRGAAPALTDLLGGQITIYFSSIPPSVSLIKSGRLKALGTSGVKRAAALPDVPTVAESGIPGFSVENWYGVVGPVGMPKEAIARLNAELAKVLASPDLRERFTADGSEAISSTPEQFAAFIRDEVQKWGKVVREAKVKVD
ncbi:MAG: tripartite tricarboxylate transporter substrate binding protein [Betaproteobacteria bacterium]|nr:tripartite tricarboxylate transporter substrate binding protein [Betaproteobacteria bacterium]